MNIVIITGASSGIGKEFARQMDYGFTNIDEFWLISRREDVLKELKDQLQHKVKLVPMDITDSISICLLEDLLRMHKVCVRVLINGAGFGILGEFINSNIKEQTDMISLNCEALTKLTHICLPYMHKNSRIIQLASSAAFLPQQNFAVYAATKAYVLSFSRALSRELKKQKIYVTAVCPGPVNTDFFKVAQKYGSKLAIKDKIMVEASQVVALALRDSFRKKELSVYSIPIKGFYFLAKLVPHRYILNFLSKIKLK